MPEVLTSGDIGQCRVNVIVVERDEGEVTESTKDGRKRTGDVDVGEVDGADGLCGRVAGDSIPVAWGAVSFVPVG